MGLTRSSKHRPQIFPLAVRAERRADRRLGRVHGQGRGPHVLFHARQSGAGLPARKALPSHSNFGSKEPIQVLRSSRSVAPRAARTTSRARSVTRTSLATSSCAIGNLWPGIDMVFRGQGGALKYEFLVRQGPTHRTSGSRTAEPNRLQSRAAASSRSATALGTLRDAAPKSTQGGGRVENTVCGVGLLVRVRARAHMTGRARC